MSEYVNQAFNIAGVEVKQTADSLIVKYKRSSEKVANFWKNEGRKNSQRSIKEDSYLFPRLVFMVVAVPALTFWLGFKMLFNTYSVIKHESDDLAIIATVITLSLLFGWYYARVWLKTTKIEICRDAIKINGESYRKQASSSFSVSEVKRIPTSVLNQPYVLLEYQNGDQHIPLNGMLKEPDAAQIVRLLNTQLA